MRKLVTSANTLLTPYIHLLPISKMSNLEKLTSDQRTELIEQYCQLIVDGMDYKSLEQYVLETMVDYVDKLSDIELKEEIGNYDDELYEELVDNVTQQYPKQLNTFEKETFLDINNTGGKY